jgi:hypothetical protein
LKRTLAWLLLLTSLSALGAGRAKKPSLPVVEPAKPPPPVEKIERAQSTPLADPIGLTGALAGGWFYGGGNNRGPLLSAQLTIAAPFLHRRLALELELDWRLSTFRSAVPDYGAITSSLHALPLYAGVRFHLIDVRPVAFDLRGGLGPLLLIHSLSSDFSPSTTRTAVGWELFIAGQARVKVSSIELFAEVRYGLGEASIRFVLGRATGLQGMIGARYVLQ